MLETVLFYSFGTLAVATAFFVVFCRHPVYSVLYLVVTMFALAGLYVMLHAYFVAAIQIIVYAGAILVLFLFVVMLLNLDQEGEGTFRTGPSRWLAIPIALAFFAEISLVLAHLSLSKSMTSIKLIDGTVESVGLLLFSRHIISFEVVSFVLLAAILGATVLAKKAWNK